MNRAQSRSRAARTSGELVPIAGYYGRLVHAQAAFTRAREIGTGLCGLPRMRYSGSSENSPTRTFVNKGTRGGPRRIMGQHKLDVRSVDLIAGRRT